MDELNARPRLLKQANLSLIRKVIKTKGTATRAEIAQETGISSTTVRSLLTEMEEGGEIESIGYDESSGGRKAERYAFKPDRYYGAVLCVTDEQLHALTVNICGEIVEKEILDIPEGKLEDAMISCMDSLTARREIKSAGIGVPGIVDGGGYWRKDRYDGELYRLDIGELVESRYQLPVVMENDLNATAIGFSRCYAKEFPDEDPGNTNMVYLHFESGCISAGLIAGGRLIRGAGNFAGEIGLVPAENGSTLDECMKDAKNDVQYVNFVVHIIGWICGILNPQYIVLGGPALRRDCIGSIQDVLSSLVPAEMSTEILYSPDVWQDYYEGMAYLTAEKIFDTVQFIKE